MDTKISLADRTYFQPFPPPPTLVGQFFFKSSLSLVLEDRLSVLNTIQNTNADTLIVGQQGLGIGLEEGKIGASSKPQEL